MEEPRTKHHLDALLDDVVETLGRLTAALPAARDCGTWPLSPGSGPGPGSG